MEKTRTEKLISKLELLEIDHKEKSKRYQKKNLLTDENLEGLWSEVYKKIGALGGISKKEERKFQEMIEGFETELDAFGKGLERYIMIREFVPVLMGHLMDKKLGEMQIISSSNTQRHMLLAKETMKYAEALADEVMKRNPDRKYLPDENVQRPENETVKSD